MLELKPAFVRSGDQGDRWRQGYISLDTVTENFQVKNFILNFLFGLNISFSSSCPFFIDVLLLYFFPPSLGGHWRRTRNGLRRRLGHWRRPIDKRRRMFGSSQENDGWHNRTRWPEITASRYIIIVNYKVICVLGLMTTTIVSINQLRLALELLCPDIWQFNKSLLFHKRHQLLYF